MTSTTTIPLDHPALNTINSDPITAWQPPLPWDQLECDRDRRTWVEALVSLGLLSKGTSGVTCRQFFRKILEYGNHWTRVGKTTCHLFTCANCGTGKMRAHRLWAADQRRYEFITSECESTFRLVIRYDAPCDSLDAYRARVTADHHYVVSLWRKMRRKFQGAGFIRSVEPDPACKDVIFRLYCVGKDIRYAWVAKQWQRIVGMQALAEGKSTWDDGKDALKWTLDSLVGVLLIKSPILRAAWEKAFDGFRLTASVGALRGAKLDAAVTELPISDDPDAPWGRCPCGCGGAIVKSEHHAPMTLHQLGEQYTRVDFGPLKTYTAYRPKADRVLPSDYWIPPTTPTESPSPPS